MGMLLAAAFLADRPAPRTSSAPRWWCWDCPCCGACCPIHSDSGALIGDLLFILAGAMGWIIHPVEEIPASTLCLPLPSLPSLALITYGPIYLADWRDHVARRHHVARLDRGASSGVLAGACVIYASAKTVQMLGASRAAIFPVMTPALPLSQLDLPGRCAAAGRRTWLSHGDGRPDRRRAL